MAAIQGLRMQVASDLHLEFYDELPPFEDLLVPSAPVLALVGDICALGDRAGRRLYKKFLEACSQRFELVLLVVGNHEFYSDHVTQQSVGEIFDYIRSLSAKESLSNIRLLENEAITLGDGVRVAGTALWSNVPESQTLEGALRLGLNRARTVEFCMNDYSLIYVDDADSPELQPGDDQQADQSVTSGRRVAMVKDTNAWHREAVEFLEREAAQATEDGVNLLVLTHHTPSFVGTSNPRYGCDPQGMSSAFSSNLEYLFDDPSGAAIHTWCFGHTHYNSDQVKSGIRLVSNQRGYPENPSFGYRADFVVEVPAAFGRTYGADSAP